MTEVKICGLTSERDVEAASRADYLGFVVEAGTRRSLSVERAGELVSVVSGRAVAVTTSTDPAFLLRVARELRPFAVQLNGPVRPEDVRSMAARAGCQVWAVCHVEDDTETLPAGLVGAADLVVLDSPSRQGGGEGRVHDWERSARLRRQVVGKPVSLAGGLTPGNVAEGVFKVRPDMVDVSSGVETNGVKDAVKINEFIETVRRCHQ